MDWIITPLALLVGVAIGFLLGRLTAKASAAAASTPQTLSGGPVGGGDVH